MFKNNKSLSISELLNHFKTRNLIHDIGSRINDTQSLNNYQSNIRKSREYNNKTLSQNNVSYMTSPQMLEYSLLNDEIKQKRKKGVLDVGSHRNKDIFIETDSEAYNSRRNSAESNYNKRESKRCSKLIVDKVVSQVPKNYNLGQGHIQKIMPYNRNQYNLRDYNNNINSNINNNLNNVNDININNLAGLNNNDIININRIINEKGNEFEYEKTEKIRIKKINDPNNIYVNNQNPNRNNFEERSVILHKIRNNENNIYPYNYEYNTKTYKSNNIYPYDYRYNTNRNNTNNIYPYNYEYNTKTYNANNTNPNDYKYNNSHNNTYSTFPYNNEYNNNNNANDTNSTIKFISYSIKEENSFFLIERMLIPKKGSLLYLIII